MWENTFSNVFKTPQKITPIAMFQKHRKHICPEPRSPLLAI